MSPCNEARAILRHARLLCSDCRRLASPDKRESRAPTSIERYLMQNMGAQKIARPDRQQIANLPWAQALQHLER